MVARYQWPAYLSGICVALAVFVCVLLPPTPALTQTQGPLYLVEIEGVVTNYTLGYLRRVLREAEASNATALIIRLGSEGAVLRALRPFATELVAAQVPVVVYVAPGGTQSGAAGSFLLSAAHIAAMAPDTSFGSALPLARVEEVLTEQTRELALQQAAEQIKDWNRARNRDTAWVERAVREGVVLSNEQAIASTPPAIDLVARDLPELVTLLEGRAVTLADARQVQISSLGQVARPLAPNGWESLLLTLANPTVAFMLLVMAAMAGYAELVSPTVGLLGGIGVVLLVGALIGLVALPIRWWGLLLLLLAFGLLAADLFTPSHGGLTVIGLVLLISGALNLFDADQAPGAQVAGWSVILVGASVATFAALGLVLALRAARQPVTTGQESLVGKIADVRKRLEPEGMVFVEGALWRAVAEADTIDVGELVEVVAVHELRLLVRRAVTTS
jgi:membrane-bound serine protease (ClpP class)